MPIKNFVRYIIATLVACCAFLINTNNIKAQELKRWIIIRGQVLAEHDKSPLEYTSIANVQRNQFTYTGENGEFVVGGVDGDQIVFSALGYDMDTLVVNESINYEQLRPTIFMTPRDYILKPVIIVPWKTYYDLKQAAIAMELPKEELPLNLPEIKNTAKPLLGGNNDVTYGPSSSGNGVAVTGLFTHLYKMVSREGKFERRRERIFAAEERKRIIAKKYNPEMVSLLTGIKDPAELEALMRYCNLPEDFILNAIAYDLLYTIKQCHQEFERR